MCRSVEYRDKLGIFTTISPSFRRLSFFILFRTSPHFHCCHSLLGSTLLYLEKCRIPWQTRDFNDHFPILSRVVILYLVPHFSMCTSVEYRDKLGIFKTISPSFRRLSFFILFRTSPHFHCCHSLLGSPLLYLEKCRIPWQTRDFQLSFPLLSFVTWHRRS